MYAMLRKLAPHLTGPEEDNEPERKLSGPLAIFAIELELHALPVARAPRLAGADKKKKQSEAA